MYDSFFLLLHNKRETMKDIVKDMCVCVFQQHTIPSLRQKINKLQAQTFPDGIKGRRISSIDFFEAFRAREWLK